MASAARKLQKRLQKASGKSTQISTAAKKQTNGMVTMRENPATGEMQEYHYTKGWR